MKPKIFVFDIETSPMTAYTWSLWTEVRSMDFITADWCMLTWAGKWLGDDEVFFDSNHLHGKPDDDSAILVSLHEYMDEADIVIAHNGNKFDIKKMNARFIQEGMEPPSHYRKIDTLLEARKNFAFSSNRLDALGEFLGVGRKVDTGGFGLWARCMAGDKQAFEDMVSYNIQDVSLLEEIYYKLRPWMQNHPNLGVYEHDTDDTKCPKCGGTDIQYRGYAYTQAAKYHRFQCNDCGGWGRVRTTDIPRGTKGIMTNVN